MNITVEQLKEIDPACRTAPQLVVLAGAISQALTTAGMTTPLRAACGLAQILWESAHLHLLEEQATGDAYENRADLGNLRPGDGRRYKGRGLIQITGRANYHAAGRALDLELEDHPELAAQPAVAARVAAYYLTSHNVPVLADKCAFSAVTRSINGAATSGPPSYHDLRLVLTARALEVLSRG